MVDPRSEARSRARGRKLPRVIRWAHTYVSLLAFGALVFFALTGLTLNHAEFFESDQSRERESEGQLPREWLALGQGEEAVLRLEIVEALREQAGLQGRVSEFRIDDQELLVICKAAGYSADVAIERSSGTFELLETRFGAWAVAHDLHKARGTGGVWSWALDLSAILLLFAGISGLWLLGYLKLRRTAGFIVTAMGIAGLLVLVQLFE